LSAVLGWEGAAVGECRSRGLECEVGGEAVALGRYVGYRRMKLPLCILKSSEVLGSEVLGSEVLASEVLGSEV
jgi:hypothetical protein